ncbi:hypothetical protein LUZ60_016193 [Juncus effusus]|nr:hypothetical protein LUZ60_016193 [Juncus effusus]
MKLFSLALFFFLLILVRNGETRNLTLGENVKKTYKKPLAPALLGFGDSIIDPGNNNRLGTVIKCDFSPYGLDFVTHRPTGRFCNGKIPTDFLASKLRIKELLPAYVGTQLTNQDLITGVSFASGGTGYDPLTPTIAGVIPMSEQIEMLKEYKQKVKGILGEKKMTELISQSIFAIVAGSDDVANTYFNTPFRQVNYDISSYSNLVLQGASNFVEQLIQLGARKIGIVSIPPIGCVPSQRTLAGGLTRDCAPGHNQMAKMINSRLTKHIDKMKKKHQNVTLVYIDIYGFLYDMIQRPTKYGFEVSNMGCCGTGLLEVAILCNPISSTVCGDVSKYVFWDSYHPTEKAYRILVDYIYDNYMHYLIDG